ncbi:MAG: hypothetical protein GWN84_02460 [Gammaproteobacteria bacterium]|nr:hypothetical protein [Gammaproteobacteria bacterium]NIR82008.1 hypothetical protein [Gammaproteobacteria bacterium]NIR89068.1 hypothetical protein [Gammaproteobacteria bacterium]NIU03115.1 hypothetical protein [Gammaproteobacteria bacterium]NIX84390.1 hypothetical protein [Gammaproteobacteria bacterium]
MKNRSVPFGPDPRSQPWVGEKCGLREAAPAAGLYLVLALTAACYWPGLSGDLVLDDYPNLQPLAAMERGELGWREVVFSRISTQTPGRPVALASFVANWLTSGPDVWVMKYTNLMIHLLCGALVFWLSGRLLAAPAVGVGPRRWWIALWVSTAWLLAPLMVSTVLYVVQRMAQLAALFVLGGLLSYVVGRQALTTHFARGVGLMGLALVLFWPLATFSKENGALLPLLILVVELCFFRFRGPVRARRAAMAAATLPVVLAAAAAGALAMRNPDWISGGYAARDFTGYERLLSQARVLFDYLANLLLLPGGSAMSLYHDDYAKSTGLLAPPTTLLSVLAWGALLVAAWHLRHARAALVLFGPLFFLSAHLVESTVFPLELYFEHRNYLPGVGIFLGMALGAWFLSSRTRHPRVLVIVLVVIPLGYAVTTYQRVLLWQSWEGMLLAAEHTHPRSARVHMGLASLYMNRPDLERAFGHLERAAALDGERRAYGIGLHYLSAYCVTDRRAPERAYVRLEALSPVGDDTYTVNALAWLAGAAERGTCPGVDLARVARAVSRTLEGSAGGGRHRRAWLLHAHAARLLRAAGDADRARLHARRARTLRAPRGQVLQ